LGAVHVAGSLMSHLLRKVKPPVCRIDIQGRHAADAVKH
jgi:hypothetical protein